MPLRFPMPSLGLLVLLLPNLLLWGCSSTSTPVALDSCPSEPFQPLMFNEVTFLKLPPDQGVTETVFITKHKSLGFSLVMEPNHTLQFKPGANMCLWLHGPDHQIVDPTNLTQAGLYTLQISSLADGVVSFDLDLRLATANGFKDGNNSPIVSSIVGNTDQNELSKPEQFIYDYYDLLNDRDYQGAWQHLTEGFRRDSFLHPEGINSYQQWWQQVNFTNLIRTELVSETEDNAIVAVELVYSKENGQKVFQNLEFSLVWNPDQGQWRLFKTKAL